MLGVPSGTGTYRYRDSFNDRKNAKLTAKNELAVLRPLEQGLDPDATDITERKALTDELAWCLTPGEPGRIFHQCGGAWKRTNYSGPADFASLGKNQGAPFTWIVQVSDPRVQLWTSSALKRQWATWILAMGNQKVSLVLSQHVCCGCRLLGRVATETYVRFWPPLLPLR